MDTPHQQTTHQSSLNPSADNGNTQNDSASYRSLPHDSEAFGSVPKHSESFGNVPQPSEPFRTVRKASEKTENHTLTVREVARLFEEAGVPRTERSIINWCCLNRQGIARLDAFFDENERRYFITPQSVTRGIEEERAKQPVTESAPVSETEIPNRSEASPRNGTPDNDRVKELERQNRDLEIATRAKDFYLERLEKERGHFAEQLVGISRYVGELETQLRQLGGAPSGNIALPQRAERDGTIPHGNGNESSPATEKSGRFF